MIEKKLTISFILKAVTDLPPDYINAVENLQSSAGNCLHMHNFPKFHLPDGSIRQTLAIDSSNVMR